MKSLDQMREASMPSRVAWKVFGDHPSTMLKIVGPVSIFFTPLKIVNGDRRQYNP